MSRRDFLPVGGEEMRRRGWDACDVVLVTGDAYVDHPSFGAALVGRHLESLGYRVGIIAQPDLSRPEELLALGRPRLFVGVTSGAMDSMVAHYTSLGRLRSEDAYTPGGRPGRRPDRALLRYVNAVKRVMGGVPVVIGGIEASLRRISHYDFWSGRVRRSILLDTKADILVYGMGERAVSEIARALEEGRGLEGIRGTATYGGSERMEALLPERHLELPSHEEAASDGRAFMRMTLEAERASLPFSDVTLVQSSDTRTLVVHPPQPPLSTGEMDRLYELPFVRSPHPSCGDRVPAFDMIRDSVTALRGCAGGCSFCGLGLHQGRHVTSRSRASVLAEIRTIAGSSGFGGTITDVGGPTADMYGLGCSDPGAEGRCRRPSCLHPEPCPRFRTDHGPYMRLLRDAEDQEGVRHVFVSSGIRHDLAVSDGEFMRQLADRHTPGYLKTAPESLSPEVCRLMRKPPPEVWERFARLFAELSGMPHSPYIIAAFPGCGPGEMRETAARLRSLRVRPSKVQVFLPTPMTVATAMYLTGLDPGGGELDVVRRPSRKRRQVEAVLGRPPGRRHKNRNGT